MNHMNTILFLSGAGVGALISTTFLLFVVAVVCKSNQKWRAATDEINAANLKALEERNEISLRQVETLELLAYRLAPPNNVIPFRTNA